MALTCNIDRRGRRVRGIMGSCLVGCGAVMIGLTWPPLWWQWGIAILLLLSGGFVLFEAGKGWCAIRAMGWRTPL